jgi:hypothetical protein
MACPWRNPVQTDDYELTASPMAIDYIVDLDCIPKQKLGTMGILERLKGQERAHSIIQLFRRNNDPRPPSEMGFEMVRTAADGSEETQILVVQHLLDAADELNPLAVHCQGCPANRTGAPFGCMGRVSYPLSGLGEAWLLNRLPEPTEPLIWLLVRQGIKEFRYDGRTARALRDAGRAHFAEDRTIYRALGELTVTSDQVFEMTFLVDGPIQPNHAGVLLLFYGAINRQLEADTIMRIGSMSAEERAAFPLLIEPDDHDDQTTAELRGFLAALYIAWRLDVQLLLDV